MLKLIIFKYYAFKFGENDNGKKLILKIILQVENDKECYGIVIS